MAARSTQRERNVGQAASLPPFSWGTLPACPSFGFSVRFPVPVSDAGPSLGLFGIHISSDGHASCVPNEECQAASLPPFSWGTLPACPSFGFSVRFPVPVPDTGPSLGLFGIHISSDGHAGSVPHVWSASLRRFCRDAAPPCRALTGLVAGFCEFFPRASEACAWALEWRPFGAFKSRDRGLGRNCVIAETVPQLTVPP